MALAHAPAPVRSTDHDRLPARVLTGVVAVLALYVATVLVPYVVGGLVGVPPAELASGLHDPSHGWPSGWLAGPVSALALPSVVLAQAAAFGAGAWATVRVVRAVRAGDRRVVALTGTTLALCVVAAAFLLSPLGTALVSRQLD